MAGIMPITPWPGMQPLGLGSMAVNLEVRPREHGQVPVPVLDDKHLRLLGH